jgi:hypothetical protein
LAASTSHRASEVIIADRVASVNFRGVVYEQPPSERVPSPRYGQTATRRAGRGALRHDRVASLLDTESKRSYRDFRPGEVM